MHIDLEWLEQTAYNEGYRRGLEAGRKQSSSQTLVELLNVKFSELEKVLRSSEAEIAMILRETLNK